MLLNFRFMNHRSFRDQVQLNLTPAYASSDRAVRVAGIFGANASGKSNLVGAMNFMSRFAGLSDRDVEPGLGLRRHSFRLDPSVEDQPSSYAVDLLLDEIRHTYGFTISNDRVLHEWLYYYPKGARRKLFEREVDKFGWGEHSKGSPLEDIALITPSPALFLSVAARFGRSEGRPQRLDDTDDQFAPLHSVYSWLWQKISRTYSNSERIDYRRLGRIDEILDRRNFSLVVDLLRSADLGLLDMSIAQPEDDDAGDIVDPGQPSVASRVRRPAKRPRLLFHHRGAIGDVVFEAGDESEGTLRLLDLAAQSLRTLRSGGLLVVDEIDASLHPLLSAQLIELFQSKAVNRLNAQLVFTSHDATLLGPLAGRDVLERDQIWFVEKDDAGASALYSLVEFKPRKEEENRQRRYLAGKYGAVPDLSMALFERALRSRNYGSDD